MQDICICQESCFLYPGWARENTTKLHATSLFDLPALAMLLKAKASHRNAFPSIGTLFLLFHTAEFRLGQLMSDDQKHNGALLIGQELRIRKLALERVVTI